MTYTHLMADRALPADYRYVVLTNPEMKSVPSYAVRSYVLTIRQDR